MNKLKLFATALLLVAIISSCKKETSRESEAITSASSKKAAETKATWVTVIPASSFSSLSTYWNNLYPWGSDHNGTARMRTQNISVSGGVLTLSATPTSGVGNSNKDPYLPIHYYSGAVHSIVKPVVDASWPKWRFSGEFQAPSTRGTWPAFWITGADSWPPETDILEYKGSATNWCNTYDGGWESTGVNISSPGNWHTYTAYVWRIGTTNNVTVEYWIDGVKRATHTGTNFVGKRFNVIINLQMEGSSGSPGPTGTTYYRARNVVVQKSATL